MRDRSLWNDDRHLVEYLAGQLIKGRLCVVLGAGASWGFGLPRWSELNKRIVAGCPQAEAALSEGAAGDIIAEHVLVDGCGGDETAFASKVRKALYSEFDASLDALTRNRTMAALGALVMASSRGRVSDVITFNYDDLVERYLAYHGFDVESVARAPEWRSRCDVRVLHPHGLLPVEDATPSALPVVLARRHMDNVVNNSSWPWRSSLLDSMTSCTCLFIGLSGDDQNLTSIIKEVSDRHVLSHDGPDYGYWGVRFGISGDRSESIWRDRGVYPRALASFDELPGVLFRVVQCAADLARAARRA